MPRSYGAKPRLFTDNSGRSITAELISVKDGVVTLKREDGQTFTVKTDTLSASDRAFLQEQEKAAGGVPKLVVTPPPPNSVVIECLIDGPSELRVNKDGIYWINGDNAKPGRHSGQEEPTYVDGKSWRPNWNNPRADRGVDRTWEKYQTRSARV